MYLYVMGLEAQHLAGTSYKQLKSAKPCLAFASGYLVRLWDCSLDGEEGHFPAAKLGLEKVVVAGHA